MHADIVCLHAVLLSLYACSRQADAYSSQTTFLQSYLLAFYQKKKRVDVYESSFVS